MRSFAFLILLCGCGTRTLEPPLADATTDVSLDADADGFTRCSTPGTCQLVARSCCGSCGAATPADMIGVSRPSEYRSSVCDGMGCPACYAEQDPFLRSFCVSGECNAVNLHDDPMTLCTDDGDCRLRYASCCEPCDAPLRGLIALRVDRIDDYRKNTCEPDPVCWKCVARYPESARAICDATKHCNVTGIAPL